MEHVSTIIIGAGQAGLAVSRCLTDWRVEHLVLERGSIAHRWRTESWDSLRLLTPNWMTRLPGWRYGGGDPDGFMTATDVADFLATFAAAFDAPVITGTTVEAVSHRGDHYVVSTDSAVYRTDHVVVATGACQLPNLPRQARPPGGATFETTPSRYRRPDDLPAGGVLVVGASASGVQIAAELTAAGREVVLAVGRHTRLPRSYRGHDIYSWLDRLGSLRAPVAGRPGHELGRTEPSAQLIGSPDRRDVDLGVLQHSGVRLAGRLVDLDARRARFADDLHEHVAAADARLRRVRDRIDSLIATRPPAVPVDPPEPFRPVPVIAPVAALDLGRSSISTIIWATGYRRTYPWLQVPVVRPDGELEQRNGTTRLPGLHVLGIPNQSRRNSAFIDGVGHDAHLVAGRIARSVGTRPRAASELIATA